jgi:tight adherence protein B
MNVTVVQIVQALAFVAVILAVEGIYLFLRSGDRREVAVNRRMKIAASRNERILNPDLFRRKVAGGDFSSLLNRFVPGFSNLIWRAAVDFTPSQVFAAMAGISVLLLMVFLGLLRMPAPISFLAAGAFGFAAPYLYLSILASQREKRFADQLPVAIDIITRGLQAGHPVPVALEMVAREVEDPIGSEFGLAIDEMNYGLDRGLALRNISQRFKSPEFRFLVSSVEMQKETGGNLAEILSNLSRVIRERATMRKKAIAVSAEGRISCFVVGGLPFLLALAILALNPAFFTDVARDPLFVPMIGGGFVLWAIGIWWIWRMVNFKV